MQILIEYVFTALYLEKDLFLNKCLSKLFLLFSWGECASKVNRVLRSFPLLVLEIIKTGNIRKF